MIIASVAGTYSTTSTSLGTSSEIALLRRQRAEIQRQIQVVQSSNAKEEEKQQQLQQLQTQLQTIDAQIQTEQAQQTMAQTTQQTQQSQQTQLQSQLQQSMKVHTKETDESMTDKTRTLYARNGSQPEKEELYGELDIYA